MDPTGHDEVTALLARYPAIARPHAKPEPLGNAGGYSGARLWRYANRPFRYGDDYEGVFRLREPELSAVGSG